MWLETLQHKFGESRIKLGRDCIHTWDFVWAEPRNSTVGFSKPTVHKGFSKARPVQNGQMELNVASQDPRKQSMSEAGLSGSQLQEVHILTSSWLS